MSALCMYKPQHWLFRLNNRLVFFLRLSKLDRWDLADDKLLGVVPVKDFINQREGL